MDVRIGISLDPSITPPSIVWKLILNWQQLAFQIGNSYVDSSNSNLPSRKQSLLRYNLIWTNQKIDRKSKLD